MSRSDPLASVHNLKRAVETARLPGDNSAIDRARRILVAYVDASAQQGRTARQIAGEMASGVPALTAARVTLDQSPDDPNLACQAGCAFCCILAGEEGAVITQAEARTLFAALVPFEGHKDGQDWHPRACPALDPTTRACRAYAARPVICRSYVSTDANACEAASRGEPGVGPGVLGPHVDYLAVHALARAALKGVAKVSTYSLAKIAQSAVEGEDQDSALSQARHRPKVLDDERRRMSAKR